MKKLIIASAIVALLLAFAGCAKFAPATETTPPADVPSPVEAEAPADGEQTPDDTAVIAPQFVANGIVYECEDTMDDEGFTGNYTYEFASGIIDVRPEEYLVMINGDFYPVAISSPDELRQVAADFGITLGDDAQSGVIPAMEFDVIEFIRGEATEFGIAENAVAWIDDGAATSGDMTEEELLTWLKEQLQPSVDTLMAREFRERDIEYLVPLSESTPEVYEQTVSEIQTRIDEMRFVEQFGRYKVFYGPYVTVVDTTDNSIYFCFFGHLFSLAYEAEQPIEHAFLGMYFFG